MTAETRDLLPPQPGGLAEIAIRCADLEGMTAFYRDIVGLTPFAYFTEDGIVFFSFGARKEDGLDRHPGVLALFRAGAGRTDVFGEVEGAPGAAPEAGPRSSLHHLALSIGYDEQEALMAWLEAKGVAYRLQLFDWIGWRGVFIEDPEGNRVEFVAFDRSLLKHAP